MNTVKLEKLSYRDKSYSLRHRFYGRRLYMFDVDAIEFDLSGNPVVMMEMKHYNYNYKKGTFQTKCLENVANSLNIPFFTNIYHPPIKEDESFEQIKTNKERYDFWFFKLYPENKIAWEEYNKLYKLGLPTKDNCLLLSEKNYIVYLHKLRNIKLDVDINSFSTKLP